MNCSCREALCFLGKTFGKNILRIALIPSAIVALLLSFGFAPLEANEGTYVTRVIECSRGAAGDGCESFDEIGTSDEMVSRYRARGYRSSQEIVQALEGDVLAQRRISRLAHGVHRPWSTLLFKFDPDTWDVHVQDVSWVNIDPHYLLRLVIGIYRGLPIDEGGTAKFTLRAEPLPLAPLPVSVTVSQTGDFLADGQTRTPTVTIGTDGTGTLTVATDDDDVDEANGAVTASLAHGDGYEVSASRGSASVTVNDNDDAEVPTIERDRAALVALYEATGGENWLRSDNWLTDAPIGSWWGVDTVDGRVVSLGLSENRLAGPIPPELGNLHSLQGLNLDRNQLTGPIPPDLGNLHSLEGLVLFDNQLTGSIPPELGNLRSLEFLGLSQNRLTGPIPPELGSLRSLQTLHLHKNQLVGPIPQELGNLHSLWRLNLYENQLTGPVPRELGNLRSLNNLFLASNRLTGPVPRELGNLRSLVRLLLYDNQLTGSLPVEMGSLGRLIRFETIDTNLCLPPALADWYADIETTSGMPVCVGLSFDPPSVADRTWFRGVPVAPLTLPAATGGEGTPTYTVTPALPAGLTFDPTTRELSGTPTELSAETTYNYTATDAGGATASLSFMIAVDEMPIIESDRAALVALYEATGGENWLRSDNWLGAASVGSWWGVDAVDGRVRSLNLGDLFTDGNRLAGPIPPELGNLRSLENLFLASNQLMGPIPLELVNLPSLRILFLPANRLTGSVPPQLANLRSLEYLVLAENQLTGTIPRELGSLPNLKDISLHGNRLTGQIPRELGSLRNLKWLAIHDNRLTGPIPPELGNLQSLEYLYLASNQLAGSIPPVLGNLRSLKELLLDGNRLTGPIPPELGSLQNLEQLTVDGNQLTGPLPVEMGSLTRLSRFETNGTALCLPSDLAEWYAGIETTSGMSACVGLSFESPSVADRTWFQGVPITPLTLPAAAGGEGTVSYTLAPALPAGLAFDPSTRVLSGTPTALSGQTTYTWTATDAGGSISLDFTIAVEAGVVSLSTTTLEINEGGSGSYTVRLAAAPPDDVTVTAHSDHGGLTVSPAALTFTPSNWSIPQTVAVEAGADDDAHDENVSIVHEVVGFPGVTDGGTISVTLVDAAPPVDTPEVEAVEETVRAVAAGSLANVTSNIGARFSSVDSGVTLTLAGQRLSLDEAAATLASFDDGLRAWPDTAPGGEDANRGRGLGFDELLRTSAFEISLGAAEGESFLAGRWTVWGRGDVLFFDDDSDVGGRYDGDLKAGYLGVDAWVDDRWLAGVAASRIVVDSTYLPEGAGDRGRLEVTLTGVHPYLRYAPEAGPELWAILGAGVGEIGDTRQEGAPQETNDLRMLMAAAGVRQNLAPVVDGIDLAVLGDAGFGRIDTDSGAGLRTIGNLSVDTWRARAGIEASHTSALESGATVTPSVEVAARLDGGGGNETGIEVSAALLYADPATGVGVEARGRMLALYSDSAYSEYGASLTASVSPGPDGEGLSLAVSPRFGAPTGGGAATLWSEDRFGLADDAVRREAAASLDAEAGFGFAVGADRRGVLTPFAALRLAAGGEGVRAGVRFGNARLAAGALTFELAGERRAYDTGGADRRIDLIGRVGF